MFSLLIGVTTRIVSNSFSNVLQKKLANSISHPSVVNFYTYLGLTILGFVFCFPSVLNNEVLKYACVMGVLGALGNYFIIKALHIGELSTVAPINSYKPVISLLLGIFVLNEIPSAFDLLGIFLIITGTFLILQKGKVSKLSLFYRFLALLFSGSEAVYIKKIIILSDIGTAFFYWALAGFVFSSFFCVKNMCMLRKVNILNAVLLVFSTALMQYSTNYVFSKMNVSSALALFQLSIIFSVFLGAKFFHEKRLLRKLIASVIMVIGAVVLIL